MPNSVRFCEDILIDFTSSTGPLVSSAWMGTVLLLFGIFINHTGEFTLFLHRIGGAYFLFSLWSGFHGSFFRFDTISDFSSIELIQADSVFFRLFFFYATVLLIIFFFGISERFFLSKRAPREFALLILFFHLGALFVIRFSTFIDLLLALEIVTLASYVLASFERQNRFSTYAGIQYFLIGSIPSARLLLGFSFFYLHGGSLVIQDLDLLYSFGEFYTQKSFFFPIYDESFNLYDLFFNRKEIGFPVYENDKIFTDFNTINYTLNIFDFYNIESLIAYINPYSSISIRGFFFIIFNLLFKITAAPFHFWAPSVYGKAPMASVTFLSIYSKIRIFFFIFSLLSGFLHFSSSLILFLFLFCGLLSIFRGRIGAFTEKRIKRFFVFSSRGHVGFRLAGFSLSTYEGFVSVFHYLPVYRLSSFLRWFMLFSRGREKTYIIQFADLKSREPLLAFFFAVLLFSRSGIPPFAGFFVKLDVLSALFDSSNFFLNYIFFFFTVASFFYYLRVIKMLFFDESNTSYLPKMVQNTSSNSMIEYPRAEIRYWLRAVLFLFLVFYIFFIQKPLFILQNERLSARLHLIQNKNCINFKLSL